MTEHADQFEDREDTEAEAENAEEDEPEVAEADSDLHETST